MYESLLHTPFLQSLGTAILYSIWQSLALLVLYKIISASAKKLSSATRFNLSVIFVFLSLGLFMFTFLKSFLTAPEFYSNVDPAFELSITTAKSLFYIPQNISGILSLSYLILLFIFLLRLVLEIYRSNKYYKVGCSLPGEHLIAFTGSAAAHLKIKRPISLWLTSRINVPATIGFFKPIILLPASCIVRLSPTQLEAIILHELSHIRRNDYMLNIMLTVAETILFFNPAVFIFVNIAKKERENCCDDLVLQSNYEPGAYANALYELGLQQYRSSTFAMNAINNKAHLFQRILRITGQQFQQTNAYSRKLGALLVLIAIMIISSPLLLKTENHFSGKIKTDKEVQNSNVVPVTHQNVKEVSPFILPSDSPATVSKKSVAPESNPTKKEENREADALSGVNTELAGLVQQLLSSAISITTNDLKSSEFNEKLHKDLDDAVKNISKTTAHFSQDEIKKMQDEISKSKEEFNKFAAINTDSLIRNIKDQLKGWELDKSTKDQLRKEISEQIQIHNKENKNTGQSGDL